LKLLWMMMMMVVSHIVSYFYALQMDETTWEFWLQILKWVLRKYVALTWFWNQTGLPLMDKELQAGIPWPVKRL
jgi:hypothetical protein